MGNSKRDVGSVYGWPPVLVYRLAELYTGRSRWTIQRAVRAGELRIAGRQKRSPVFRREDLDRWLAGEIEAKS
jgi:hypothetical protein